MIFEMSQVLTEKVWPPYEIQIITTVDSVTRLRWGLISVFNVPTPHRGEREESQQTFNLPPCHLLTLLLAESDVIRLSVPRGGGSWSVL